MKTPSVGTPTPIIRVIGLSHHTAPMPVRERVAFRPDDYADVLKHLVFTGEAKEGVLLSTCNRSELVEVLPPTSVEDAPEFRRILGERAGEPVDPYLYTYRGRAAVQHLFRVAASLDSLVVGEAQILGQVQEAWEAAGAAGTTGPVLDRLFSRARQTAKRIRTETGIGSAHVSVASVAVDLAAKIFSSLEGRSALILGAGDTSRLTLQHMQAAGIRRVWLANRSAERAEAAVEGFETATPVPLERRHELLAEVDVVISATAADEFLFSRADVSAAMARRRRRPIFLIDLAVPRDIDPAAAQLDGVFLFNVDDLQKVVEKNLAGRRKEAERAEQIILDETLRFLSWWESRQAVPTVVALRQRLDTVRQGEESRVLARLRHLDPKDRAIVEAYGVALVNKLLHTPTVRLKGASADEAARLAEALRDLFDLVDGSDDDPDDERE